MYIGSLWLSLNAMERSSCPSQTDEKNQCILWKEIPEYQNKCEGQMSMHKILEDIMISQKLFNNESKDATFSPVVLLNLLVILG